MKKGRRMEELPDIYYKKEWKELYAEKDNGVPEEYKLKCKYGTIIYPYIKRSIKGETEYFDIITPYGFNGPIILNSSDRQKLVEEYEQDFNKYCKEKGIIAEYIRFSPWFKNYLDFQDYYELKLNKKTIAIDLTVDDILMQEISSRTRNKIRNSIKKGVEIKFDFEGKTVDDFYRLYQKTISKNNIGEYYWLSKEFLKKHFGEYLAIRHLLWLL